MCGISHMTIRRVLKDENYNPTSDTIIKIADALDITASQLMQDDVSNDIELGVNGFIEYNGEILKINTFKALKKLVSRFIYETEELPKEANAIITQDKANKETQSKQPLDISSINLFQKEQYDTLKVATWDFRKSDDEREEMPNNLGNMCKGYEFDVSGIHFLNSEAAYICGLFSNDSKEHQDIQKELIAEPNGYSTKKVIRRKYKNLGRKDWEQFNVQWMLYVVWQKVRQNKAFSALLKRIPNNYTIIENSTHQKAKSDEKDTSKFWGAKNKELEDKRDIAEYYEMVKNYDKKKANIAVLKMQARNNISNFGIWKGVNCMGKILTICKHCIENGTQPPIDYELLRSKNIYLLGQLLTFDDEAYKHQPKKIKKQ
jgi:transcriptional regulator with XRE-family HTH domain